MYSIIFIPIKVFIICSLLIFCCLSCDNPARTDSPPQNRKEESPAGGKTAEEHSPVKEEQGSLDNENVTEFLRAYAQKHPENEIRVITPMGNIDIVLYENTPLHRANFLYLAEENYFDGTWFYRVSKDHVIQAGDNDELETVKKRERLGDYTVPSEIEAGNIHKRGAVAAARTYNNNPGKRSSPFEFYIILGDVYSPAQLKLIEEKYEIQLNERQERIYSTIGGGPHLDGEHTVFGEVTGGMDVVEKINAVRVDEGEWPLKNIPIKVEVLDGNFSQ